MRREYREILNAAIMAASSGLPVDPRFIVNDFSANGCTAKRQYLTGTSTWTDDPNVTLAIPDAYERCLEMMLHGSVPGIFSKWYDTDLDMAVIISAVDGGGTYGNGFKIRKTDAAAVSFVGIGPGVASVAFANPVLNATRVRIDGSGNAANQVCSVNMLNVTKYGKLRCNRSGTYNTPSAGTMNWTHDCDFGNSYMDPVDIGSPLENGKQFNLPCAFLSKNWGDVPIVIESTFRQAIVILHLPGPFLRERLAKTIQDNTFQHFMANFKAILSGASYMQESIDFTTTNVQVRTWTPLMTYLRPLDRLSAAFMSPSGNLSPTDTWRLWSFIFNNSAFPNAPDAVNCSNFSVTKTNGQNTGNYQAIKLAQIKYPDVID